MPPQTFVGLAAVLDGVTYRLGDGWVGCYLIAGHGGQLRGVDLGHACGVLCALGADSGLTHRRRGLLGPFAFLHALVRLAAVGHLDSLKRSMNNSSTPRRHTF
jgi:hypothetical protein